MILDRSVYNAQRLPGVKNETERHAGAVDCSGGPGGRPVVLPQLAPKIVHFTTCGKPSHVGPADGGGGADGGDPCARYHRAWRQRWRLALNASGRAEP